MHRGPWTLTHAGAERYPDLPRGRSKEHEVDESQFILECHHISGSAQSELVSAVWMILCPRATAQPGPLSRFATYDCLPL